MAKSFKEFLGLPTVRVGGLDSMHPIADLGDTPQKVKVVERQEQQVFRRTIHHKHQVL